MRSLLKLAVILFCVQRGEGHWLRSLIDQKRETASPHTSPNEDKRSRYPADEDSQTEASGVGPSPHPSIPIPVRSRRSTTESQCGLRSILLQVRDLGLGYDSDETVLFKYCSGKCPRVLSNHDLTLTNLLVSGVLPHPAPGELWHNAPCCRPTHHEDMAFLDNSHRWHKVEKLSAAGCSCVG
ncbi:persephin-like [Seriola dumerili]|uniref:persephin-like n=1 Tax=Seriola dumerili TaxID=41447 RepID=UPI000BBE8C52|nr:persephin-like [Seriola dumerili]